MFSNKHSKKILILAIVVLVAVGAFFVLRGHKATDSADSWQDGVNYRPPTEEEKNAGDEQKKQISEQSNQTNTPSPQQQSQTKKSVDVQITDANQYNDIVEVRSFVQSYSEDGTCTITFTQDSEVVKRTTPGYKDVSSTICPTVDVKISDFPNSGQWQVVVSFESAHAKGQSVARTFTVKK